MLRGLVETEAGCWFMVGTRDERVGMVIEAPQGVPMLSTWLTPAEARTLSRELSEAADRASP